VCVCVCVRERERERANFTSERLVYCTPFFHSFRPLDCKIICFGRVPIYLAVFLKRLCLRDLYELAVCVSS
jgi:hypothetical protein